MFLELPVTAGCPVRICLPADTEFVQYSYDSSIFTSNCTQHIRIFNVCEKENFVHAYVYLIYIFFT